MLQTEPHRDVTHVIVESGSADAKELPAALKKAHVVTPDWLVVTLERGTPQPEDQYAVQQDAGALLCQLSLGRAYAPTFRDCRMSCGI